MAVKWAGVCNFLEFLFILLNINHSLNRHWNCPSSSWTSFHWLWKVSRNRLYSEKDTENVTKLNQVRKILTLIFAFWGCSDLDDSLYELPLRSEQPQNAKIHLQIEQKPGRFLIRFSRHFWANFCFFEKTLTSDVICRGCLCNQPRRSLVNSISKGKILSQNCSCFRAVFFQVFAKLCHSS